MEATVYLLMFNGETMFASKNITVLWHSMYNRCVGDRHQLPEAYATVRRRILAENKYSHQAAPGIVYHIIERQLIRKPIQRKLDLFQNTVVKQS